MFDGLVKAFKQWRTWQIGTIHEVGWIADGTTPGISITAAIPPIFEAYATWRTGHMRGADVLPDLFFPEDRSWLVSVLWDDTWTCIGGSDALIEVLRKDPLIKAHRVELDGDAKPLGRERE